MRWESIRLRLTVWYSLALAAALVLFGIALWLSMRHSLRNDVDQTLVERMRSISVFLRNELQDPAVDLPRELAEYSQAFPAGTSVSVDAPRGQPSYTSHPNFPWASVSSRAGVQTFRWHGRSFETLRSDIQIADNSWRITFAVSLENVNATLSRLGWLLLTLVPVVALLAPVAGAWLSRRALRPFDKITLAARQIGIRNLSERLDVKPTGDELERLATTWNSMLARLEDAVMRLSRFTADASHELRTPLAVIRSTAEISLRKARSPEAYRAALENVVDESGRMTLLIEDLLFLARCDADQVDLPQQSFSLAQTVNDVCGQMKGSAEARGVRLAAEAPPLDSTIFANPSAIRRLLLILVDNAVKYCRTGGAVTVLLSRQLNTIHLAVEDNGPGIPDEELPFIFQRFYRAAGGRDNGNTGFGLGLALAEGIAAFHHTRVEVSSIPGRGSTFAVNFPASSG